MTRTLCTRHLDTDATTHDKSSRDENKTSLRERSET